MMEKLINSKHKLMYYELKEGTKSSYYQTHGAVNILPRRLSFIQFDGKQNHRKAMYQINGKYKQLELGLYYNMNNREVHSKLMPIPGFPQFVGWGDIDQRFGIYDLVILESTNNCKQSFTIHHFKGLAKPDYLEAVCQYLLKRQKP